MNLFEKINADLKGSMKSKNALRLATIRMMKSKVLLVNARGDLADAEIIRILSKYASSLKEAIEEAKKAERADVAETTEKELVIVKEYLPKQLSEEEIKALVESAIKETGAASKKDMGKVMKAVIASNAGIDGKVVSKWASQLLP